MRCLILLVALLATACGKDQCMFALSGENMATAQDACQIYGGVRYLEEVYSFLSDSNGRVTKITVSCVDGTTITKVYKRK